MTALPSLAVAGLLAAAFAAQPGVGAKFGARDPRTCPNAKAPARGAPSAAQAAQYVACALEGETGSGNLFLVEDLRVDVGGGRPYQHVEDSRGDIDPRQPVYPIRGSYTSYVCGRLYTPQQVAGGWADNRGTNCAVAHVVRMSGRCYRTTFADWRCGLGGGVDDPARPGRDNVAPPTTAR